MSRKVFISFLGAGFYQPTFYVAEGQNETDVPATRFIQEATISHFATSFNHADKIYVFTTVGALINWEDNNHKQSANENVVYYDGLKTCLNKLDLNAEFKNICIKDGKSPEELWEIFRDVFELIQEGDTLIFDITHGFRTLPMFNMVLINYAKLLKDISVSGIYYGAYDARYKLDGKEYSPIWNLKDFQLLQDWTNTANIFLKTGNAMPLAEMIEDENGQEIKNGLKLFSKQILVNRGMSIFSGKDAINLRELLKRRQNRIENAVDNKTIIEVPLTPILEKIKDEFDLYESNHPINGFLAVHWAIRNGLIQQGTTMLEESVTSFVMNDIGQGEYISDASKRMSSSAALTVGENVPFNYTNVKELCENEKEEKQKAIAIANLKWEIEFVPVIRNLPYKKKLGECVNSIKQSIRNDINHAGFRKDARGYDELEVSLKKRYREIKKILKDIGKMDLPELN